MQWQILREKWDFNIHKFTTFQSNSELMEALLRSSTETLMKDFRTGYFWRIVKTTKNKQIWLTWAYKPRTILKGLPANKIRTSWSTQKNRCTWLQQEATEMQEWWKKKTTAQECAWKQGMSGVKSWFSKHLNCTTDERKTEKVSLQHTVQWRCASSLNEPFRSCHSLSFHFTVHRSKPNPRYVLYHGVSKKGQNLKMHSEKTIYVQCRNAWKNERNERADTAIHSKTKWNHITQKRKLR